jgi:hypothetical protein
VVGLAIHVKTGVTAIAHIATTNTVVTTFTPKSF